MNYTTDIWFAGFLVRQGNVIKNIDRSQKRARLGFDLSDEQWSKYKLLWSESEDMAIKYTHEKIKDIVFQ